MSLFKNNASQFILQQKPSPQLLVGILCGIIICKLWNWKKKSPKESTTTNAEISMFPNIFGSNTYTPCKCGFPHQVCNECKDEKSSTEFPANVLLFSKSIENELPEGGIPFTFYTELTIDTIENIALQLDISVPVQYGTVMIHYPTNQEIELLWCANTSEEAKNVFPIRELLSRIVQICECSKSLGYDYKPITSMIIHDIDVYL